MTRNYQNNKKNNNKQKSSKPAGNINNENKDSDLKQKKINLNYLFNKEYYRYIGTLDAQNDDTKGIKFSSSKRNENHIEECNNNLKGIVFNAENIPLLYIADNDNNYKKFRLKTFYPGLLIGLGNTHESKSTDAEIRFGFTFDYVTGMPVIHGSTVKGVLRSPFVNAPEYIAEILGFGESEEAINKVKDLKNAIFGGDENTDINSRDVFFDAVIVCGGEGGRILGIDYITPHINKEKPELDGLTEPTPLTMLKVIPDVTFEFRFIIRKNAIEGSNVTKIDLFKTIIQDLGIGAKTNTGFGGMKEV